jgi:uncharacterized membrane protein
MGLIAVPVTVGIAWPAFRRYWSWLGALVAGKTPNLPRPARQPFWLAVAGVATLYFVWTVTHLRYNDLSEPGDTVTRLVATLPLMLAVVVLFSSLSARARAGVRDAEQFVLLTALLAVCLLYGAELFFVHDLFGNRMNTVFKLYYQSWIILSVVGAYGLFWWWRAHTILRGWKLLWSRIAAVTACVLLIGPLYYPLAALASKPEYRASPTLDGLSRVQRASPTERRAIAELWKVAKPGERMVEAVGGSYTEFGRISGSTGLPTVLNWPGHEHQWRGTQDVFKGREAEVETLYMTASAAEAERIVSKYGIHYVIVGRRERQKYTGLNSEKFDQIGRRIFEEDDFVIYRVGEARVGT